MAKPTNSTESGIGSSGPRVFSPQEVESQITQFLEGNSVAIAGNTKQKLVDEFQAWINSKLDEYEKEKGKTKVDLESRYESLLDDSIQRGYLNPRNPKRNTREDSLRKEMGIIEDAPLTFDDSVVPLRLILEGG